MVSCWVSDSVLGLTLTPGVVGRRGCLAECCHRRAFADSLVQQKLHFRYPPHLQSVYTLLCDRGVWLRVSALCKVVMFTLLVVSFVACLALVCPVRASGFFSAEVPALRPSRLEKTESAPSTLFSARDELASLVSLLRMASSYRPAAAWIRPDLGWLFRCRCFGGKELRALALFQSPIPCSTASPGNRLGDLLLHCGMRIGQRTCLPVERSLKESGAKSWLNTPPSFI